MRRGHMHMARLFADVCVGGGGGGGANTCPVVQSPVVFFLPLA